MEENSILKMICWYAVILVTVIGAPIFSFVITWVVSGNAGCRRAGVILRDVSWEKAGSTYPPVAKLLYQTRVKDALYHMQFFSATPTGHNGCNSAALLCWYMRVVEPRKKHCASSIKCYR